eukprot:1159221-Pelagomonas_calceolata.AAC.18
MGCVLRPLPCVYACVHSAKRVLRPGDDDAAEGAGDAEAAQTGQGGNHACAQAQGAGTSLH